MAPRTYGVGHGAGLQAFLQEQLYALRGGREADRQHVVQLANTRKCAPPPHAQLPSRAGPTALGCLTRRLVPSLSIQLCLKPHPPTPVRNASVKTHALQTSKGQSILKASLCDTLPEQIGMGLLYFKVPCLAVELLPN